MRANPGGQLDPSEVLGRDDFIRRLWRILKRQSLVLSAERRMGKTSVIKKMVDEGPEDMLLIYHDLEGIQTPLEFVEVIFRDVENHLSRFRRNAQRTRRFLEQMEGASFMGLKFPKIAAPHWKGLLNKTLEDLMDHQNHTVIFFWDELPLMLYKIHQSEGEQVAMEILDALRSLRQMHTGLRMVFTGSIGLHNILSSLKQAGYANAPTSDMGIEEVPPL
ncbi:MAG: ATP-binding protein, partial [bacterium]|nr:ATP-binding protein [bacterium]